MIHQALLRRMLSKAFSKPIVNHLNVNQYARTNTKLLDYNPILKTLYNKAVTIEDQNLWEKGLELKKKNSQKI